jgi:hypothetical protein
MPYERWICGTDRGQAAAAAQVAHAPDFVRHDRGPEDDHWARVLGAICTRCAALIEPEEFVRRQADGEWVHEQCPMPRHIFIEW